VTAPKIPDGPEGQPVRFAFAQFGLDPRQSKHWIELVRILALDHFPAEASPPPRKGGRKRWDDRAVWHLLQVYCQFCAIWPDDSKEEIYKRIAKHYGDVDWKTVKRKLMDAKNPNRNGILKRTVDGLVTEFNLDRRTVIDRLTGVVRIARRF
jgi:hypothetical protein